MPVKIQRITVVDIKLGLFEMLEDDTSEGYVLLQYRMFKIKKIFKFYGLPFCNMMRISFKNSIKLLVMTGTEI